MSGAASLVDEAVASLTNTLNAQKQALDGWQVTRGEDTEMMRVALRRYRDFLDRLLGL
jgi:CHAD domain-containing protein